MTNSYFEEKLTETLVVYGTMVGIDINTTSNLGAGDLLWKPGTGAKMALIQSFSYHETCHKLPFPMLLPVPDEGTDPDQEDSCAAPNSKQWKLKLNWPIISLKPWVGSVKELLLLETKGSNRDERQNQINNYYAAAGGKAMFTGPAFATPPEALAGAVLLIPDLVRWVLEHHGIEIVESMCKIDHFTVSNWTHVWCNHIPLPNTYVGYVAWKP